MSTDYDSAEGQVSDGAMEDSSDAFSDTSEDGDGMFDIFTGDLKNAHGEAEFSEAFEESVQATGQALPYVYGSLKGTNNIRVLDIEPNEAFEAPLKGKLRLTPLHDPCKYLAVSYAWGQLHADGSHLCETLYIDDHPLKVTSSLHAGLRLWVDGACIDQTNQAERGHQVSLMDSIFRSCYSLIIYLGENARDESERQLFNSPNFSYETAALLYDADPKNFEAEPLTPPPGHLSMNVYIQCHLMSIRSLLHRSWFSRRWVVQELLNGYGPRARVIVGNIAVICDAVRNLMVTVSMQKSTLTADRENSVGDYPSPASFFTQGSQYRSVLDFMQQCDELCCSDDRDRIYGLLGAFKPGSSQIKPDYSKKLEDVYCDFASEQVATGNAIQLLTCAISRIDAEKVETNGLPSWVPDWRVKIQYHSRLHKYAAETDMSVYRLSKLRGPTYVTRMQSPEHEPRLALAMQGCLLRPSLTFTNPDKMRVWDPEILHLSSEVMSAFLEGMDAESLMSLDNALSRLEDFDAIPPDVSQEDTPLRLLPSLGEKRSLGLDLMQIIQQLAMYDQYLCFFDGGPRAFVLRLRERCSCIDTIKGLTHETYELVHYLGLSLYGTSASEFWAFVRQIPQETIYLI